MKKSIHNLTFKVPDSLDASEQVHAWFTLKNSDFDSEERAIRGLNLGYNTQEQEEVVEANRNKLIKILQLDPAWIAYAEQVHSNKVQIVSQGGIYPETDALVTQIPGLSLSIQVADCAAVLLWDDTNKVIGAAHAGWRGAAGDIIPRTIRRMISSGTREQLIKAYVSPCISMPNFEVGMEVAEQFPDRFVDYDSYEKPHIDLKRFIKYQLTKEGLLARNIEIDEDCTVDKEELYYSYRREGQMSGRMMGLIHMR